MKRIRLLGLALIAVFALGAFASASAFAENPQILVEGKVPTAERPATFTARSTGETTMQGTVEKDEFTCIKAEGKGEFTSERLGTVAITFKECGSNGSKCNTSGAGAGEVLLKEGGLHLVDVLPTGTLDLGIWIEPHNGSGVMETLKCGVLGIEVLNSLIGVIDNAKGELLASGAGAATAYIALWKEEEKEKRQVLGEQQIKECDLDLNFCFELNADKKPTEVHKKVGITTTFGKGEELIALIMDFELSFAAAVTFDF